MRRDLEIAFNADNARPEYVVALAEFFTRHAGKPT